MNLKGIMKMTKKHPNHGVPKGKHRERSRKHTLSEKIKLAQQSSLRQRPPAPITLAREPWKVQA